MQIHYLADCEKHIDTLAEWHQKAFGYMNPTITIDHRKARLRETLRRRELPLTMVACSPTGAAICTATLLPETLTHPHLAPWLSMVVVPPESRGQGIASTLSLRLTYEAARMGFETIYLFTSQNESLYRRLGWETIETSDLNGLRIAIMARPTTI